MHKAFPILVFLFLLILGSCQLKDVSRRNNYSYQIFNAEGEEIAAYQVYHNDSTQIELRIDSKGSMGMVSRTMDSTKWFQKNEEGCFWTTLTEKDANGIALRRFADEISILPPCDSENWWECDSIQLRFTDERTRIRLHFEDIQDSLWLYPELKKRVKRLSKFVNGELVETWKLSGEEPEATVEMLASHEDTCAYREPEVLFTELREALLASDNFLLMIKAKDADSYKLIKPFSVDISLNGNDYIKIDTTSTSAEIYLPFKGVFRIEVGADGYLSKNIELDLNTIPEDQRSGGYETITDFTLFEPVEGFDESLLRLPIGKGGYSPESESFQFDFGYTEERLKLINASLEEALKDSSAP